MPFGKWSSFEDCVNEFVSQGKTEEQAKRICGALKARLEKEAARQVFSWEGEIAPQQSNLVSGKAIHPIKTFHPEEWPSIRVYLEEELRKAAGSLVGAPLVLDHASLLDGKVLDAKYVDGAVEYVAELNNEEVLDWIRKGVIKNCSVEYDWGSLEEVNGAAPRNIQFTGLALLKDFEPGDPASSVKIWNQILERIKEAKNLTPQNPSLPQVSEATNAKTNKQKDSEKEPETGETVEDLKARLAVLMGQKKALEEALEPAEERVKALEKEKTDLTRRLGEAVIDPSAEKITDPVSRKRVAEMLEAVIPPDQVVFRHGQTGGFRRLVNEIRRVKKEIEEAEA